MLKDDVLRLREIPLIVPMPGTRHPRGTQLRLELLGWDEVDLTVEARVLEVTTLSTDIAAEVTLEEADITDESEQLAEVPAIDAGAPVPVSPPAAS